MQNHLITVIIYSFNQNKLYVILLIDTCKYKYFSQMKLNEFKKWKFGIEIPLDKFLVQCL